MWRHNAGISIYTPHEGEASRNLLIIPLNRGLIRSSTGRDRVLGEDEWVFEYPNIPVLIRCMSKKSPRLDGEASKFTVVVVGNHPSTADDGYLAQLVENINRELKVAPYYFFARGLHSIYRYPGKSMWDVIRTTLFQDVDAVPLISSFIIGKKEEEVVQFALQIGIDFIDIEPYAIGDSIEPIPDALEITMTVGQPGTRWPEAVDIFRRAGYKIIDSDALDAVLSARKSLNHKRSVMITGYNPSPEDRQPYLLMAKMLDIPIRIFWFTRSVSKEEETNSAERIAHYRNVFVSPKLDRNVNDRVILQIVD